jgi:hypothetical protein
MTRCSRSKHREWGPLFVKASAHSLICIPLPTHRRRSAAARGARGARRARLRLSVRLPCFPARSLGFGRARAPALRRCRSAPPPVWGWCVPPCLLSFLTPGLVLAFALSMVLLAGGSMVGGAFYTFRVGERRFLLCGLLVLVHCFCCCLLRACVLRVPPSLFLVGSRPVLAARASYAAGATKALSATRRRRRLSLPVWGAALAARGLFVPALARLFWRRLSRFVTSPCVCVYAHPDTRARTQP